MKNSMREKFLFGLTLTERKKLFVSMFQNSGKKFYSCLPNEIQ